MDDEDLQTPAAIASVLASKTTLSRDRIAELLNMKSSGNVSQPILRLRKIEDRNIDRKIKKFLKSQE